MKVSCQLQLYGKIDNLLDKDPPVSNLGGGGVAPPVNLGLYDNIGRRFTVGFRFHD